MENLYCNAYIESKRSYLRENFLAIKKHIGDKVNVIPVFKADGYGFGDIEAFQTLSDVGADLFAVAQVIEAVRVREAGFNVPILVLGGVPVHNFPYAVKYNVQLVVFNEENAKALNEAAAAQGKIAEVQIKLNTGMNRIGIRPENFVPFLAFLKTLKNIKVVGIFTHFCNADYYNDPFTLHQYELFKECVEIIKKDSFFELRYIHCRNSCGTIWVPDTICNYVRPAALLQGFGQMADGSAPIPLKETLSMRSFITAINEVSPGESVGYGRFFKPTKKSRIATVCMGYGDGLPRALCTVNAGPVLVNDTLCHYAGLCMDQLFIDVTDCDCKVGDEITVFGRSKSGKAFLSAIEVGKHAGPACTYHTLITCATRRVARIYID